MLLWFRRGTQIIVSDKPGTAAVDRSSHSTSTQGCNSNAVLTIKQNFKI